MTTPGQIDRFSLLQGHHYLVGANGMRSTLFGCAGLAEMLHKVFRPIRSCSDHTLSPSCRHAAYKQQGHGDGADPRVWAESSHGRRYKERPV